MTTAELINQDSGNVEYYTAPEIVEAARRAMGGIDFDPFSSPVANDRVKAERYCTSPEHFSYEMLWPRTALLDGFAQPWSGRVWCNHPFGRDTNPLFSRKITAEIGRGEIKAICWITFAATSEKWFRPFLYFPQCFVSPRLNYHTPDGMIKRGVTKGSVVTFASADPDLVAGFYREFAPFGVLKAAISVA